MFHRDLRIVGVSQEQANALWDLLTFKGRERPKVAFSILREGAPLILTDGSRTLTLPPNCGKIVTENLEEIVKRLQLKIFVAIEQEAIGNLVEQIQQKFRFKEDNFHATEVVLRCMKQAHEEGKLFIYPPLFTFLLDLDASRMRKFFDIVLPMGSSLVFYLFDGQMVESGLVLVRGGEWIDLIVGHDEVRKLARSFYPWQKGYPAILEAVKNVYFPPSLGFFADVQHVRDVLWQPQPGRFLGGFLGGKIVIDPLPGWVAAALGIDAIWGVARTSVELLRQLDTIGISRRFDLSSVRRSVQQRLQGEEITLESILGFDPIMLATKLISWLATK